MDDTPYLIVDNQRLSPVGRISRIDRTFRSRTAVEREIVDVVDRVSISKEARRKAKQMLAEKSSASPSHHRLPSPRQFTKASNVLLTYSPKSLR